MEFLIFSALIKIAKVTGEQNFQEESDNFIKYIWRLKVCYIHDTYLKQIICKFLCKIAKVTGEQKFQKVVAVPELKIFGA